jgi:tetratricopeptide (TPR) repeat protein
MDHQNIARVLDAGTTDAGRPYFVMELVYGVPITKYCDDNHLTIRERLELFVPVCKAVQHAHQKGIIHRDLKPSNVLVCLYDGQPVPKVIDFGVAKAVEQRLTERTMFTQYGQIVGTFEYMSPEQAEMSQLGVDTRSDIYSLGVMLYELLTGSTPFQRLREAGLTEMLRTIKEQEPPRPSTRLSSTQEVVKIAAARRTQPAQLAKLLRGELDWMVMKALEKDRSRRYETANGLARDIERYLHDEPMEAGAPGAGYRLGKFVRRHKARLAVAGLVLFLLVLVGGGVGWLAADRAARHREAERKIVEALETAEPLLAEGNPGNLALVSAAQRVEAQLAGGAVGPEVRLRAEQLLRDAHLLADLDQTRLRRADSREGVLFDDAGAAARYAELFGGYGIAVLGMDPAQAAAGIRASAIREALLAGLDDWMQIKPERDPAQARLREVADAADDNAWRRAFREAVLALDDQKLNALAAQPQALKQPPAVLAWLGSVLEGRGLHAEAVAVLRQAQQRHPADFWINRLLGNILCWGKNEQHPEEAVGYSRAAVAIRPGSADAHNMVGECLRFKGDMDAALADSLQAGSDRRPGRHAASTLDAALAPPVMLMPPAAPRKGVPSALDAAIAAYQQALVLDPRIPTVQDNLGSALLRKGDLNGAIRCFQKAIELDPKYAWAHTDLGIALTEQKKVDEAIACFHTALEFDPKFAPGLNYLGRALVQQGKLDKAIDAYRAAIQFYPEYAEAHCNLGHALRLRGELRKGLEELLRGHELGMRNPCWRYPSAQWVREAEQRIALEGKLPKVLRGEAQPADAAEQRALAKLCKRYKRLYAAASRFYTQAFAAQPDLADDLDAGDRYDAACAAALAGCGQGEDAAPLKEQERARLRRQALTWLRAELALRAKPVAGSRPGDRDAARQALKHWLEDPDLAGVRGEALAKLPEAERQPWRQLWADVAETLARAQCQAAEPNRRGGGLDLHVDAAFRGRSRSDASHCRSSRVKPGTRLNSRVSWVTSVIDRSSATNRLPSSPPRLPRSTSACSICWAMPPCNRSPSGRWKA